MWVLLLCTPVTDDGTLIATHMFCCMLFTQLTYAEYKNRDVTNVLVYICFLYLLVCEFTHLACTWSCFMTVVVSVMNMIFSNICYGLCTMLFIWRLSQFIVMMTGNWGQLCRAINYMIPCTMMVCRLKFSKCLCCVLVCPSGWISRCVLRLDAGLSKDQAAFFDCQFSNRYYSTSYSGRTNL